MRIALSFLILLFLILNFIYRFIIFPVKLIEDHIFFSKSFFKILWLSPTPP